MKGMGNQPHEMEHRGSGERSREQRNFPSMRKNGITNGAGKGFTNGNGKGFTNGAGNGLTNGAGSGFVNGSGESLSGVRSDIRSGQKGGKKSLISVIIVMLLMSGIVAAVVHIPQPDRNIVIDGDFSDWNDVLKHVDERNLSVPENIDIHEYATIKQDSDIAFYVSVYGKMLHGDGKERNDTASSQDPNRVYVAEKVEKLIPNGDGKDVAYIFLDTDSNISTGFRASGNMPIGADAAIEITGRNGKVIGSRVLLFSGDSQTDWKWKIGSPYVAAAADGSRMECMADMKDVGVKDRYQVYFYMVDWQGRSSYSEKSLDSDAPSGEAGTRSATDYGASSLTTHSPIRIDGNANFTAANGVSHGNGTAENPYVIENLRIDGNGASYGIYIGNATVHFVIRNCTVENASGTYSEPYYPNSNIVLYNVTNGTVYNNTVRNADNNGIYVLGWSDNTYVEKNTVSSCHYGIVVYRGNGTHILNNNVSGMNSDGIRVDTGNATVIESNRVNSSGINGIILVQKCNNTEIGHNTITDSGDSGIYAYDSNNMEADSNLLLNNSCGIHLSSTVNSMIYDNYLNNTVNAKVEGEGVNHWNCDPKEGMNIIGGPMLGGNYWANSNGTGVSQTAVNGTGVGMSRDAYTIAANNTDEHPLMDEEIRNFTITRPGYIKTPGDYVIGENYTWNLSWNGIWIMVSNVSIDGENHTVLGGNISGSYGVYAYRYSEIDNISVEHITLKHWENSLYYRQVNHGVIEHFKSSENTNDNIHLLNCENITTMDTELRLHADSDYHKSAYYAENVKHGLIENITITGTGHEFGFNIPSSEDLRIRDFNVSSVINNDVTNSKIISFENGTVNTQDSDYCLKFDGSDDVLVANITLGGSDSQYGIYVRDGSNHRIENISLYTRVSEDFIYFDYMENITIENIDIHNESDVDIIIGNSNDIRINDVYSDSPASFANLEITSASYLNISNLSFERALQTGNTHAAIQLLDCHDMLIRDSKIGNNTYSDERGDQYWFTYGILFDISQTRFENITIESARYGVVMGATDDPLKDVLLTGLHINLTTVRDSGGNALLSQGIVFLDSNFYNLTVENSYITGADEGVRVDAWGDVRGVRITRTTVTDVNNEGIYVRAMRGTLTLDNNTVKNVPRGIDTYDSYFKDSVVRAENNTVLNCSDAGIKFWTEDNIAYGNRVFNCNRGIYLPSGHNTILHNQVFNNSIGIEVDSANNTIYDNYFNNTENVKIDNESFTNQWNSSSITVGPNVVNGPMISGNYWALPNGTGFSQTHEANSMGFTDVPYHIDANNTDERPLARSAGQNITNCTYINKPGVYYLRGDISSYCKYGIAIMSSNVTLIGNGHWINRTSNNTFGGTVGIYLSENHLRNITIKDLKIHDWDRLLYVKNVENLTLDGVEMYLPRADKAVYLESSRDVVLNHMKFGDFQTSYSYEVYMNNMDSITIENSQAMMSGNNGPVNYFYAESSRNITIDNLSAPSYINWLIYFHNSHNGLVRHLHVHGSSGDRPSGLCVYGSSDVLFEDMDAPYGSIQPDGWATDLTVRNGTLGAYFGYAARDILIDNMTFSSSTDMHCVDINGYESNLTIRNTVIDFYDAYGGPSLAIWAGHDIHIYNTSVRCVVDNAVSISGADHIIINGSEMYGSSKNALYVDSDVNVVRILNSSIHDSGTGAFLRCSDIVIENTKFYGISGDDIGGGPSDIILANNSITGGSNGIYLTGGGNMTMEGNVIEGTSRGIDIENSHDIHVRGNVLNSTGSYAIYTQGVSDIYTGNNSISGGDDAIYMTGGGNMTMEGNVIEGTSRGIYVENSHDVYVRSNSLNGTCSYGMEIKGVQNLYVSNNSINNTKCQGIYLKDVHGGEINGNVLPGPEIAADDTKTADTSTGLVAYYSMDEGNGTALVDHSGSGNNGTVVNGTWVEGHKGHALHFNGTGYASAPVTVNWTQLTVALWFRADNLSSGNARLIANSHTDIDRNGFQMMFNSSGQSGFFDIGNGSAVGNAYWNYPLKEGRWYFASLVYDGSEVKAYMDGRLVGSTQFNGGPISASGYDVMLARDPAYDSADFFNGTVDEVRIYSRALNFSELMTLYDKEIAYYSMDEGNGTTLVDHSDNAYNGTIINGTWVAGHNGTALDFNGDGYASIPMEVNWEQFTVMLWFRADDFNGNSRLVANSHTDEDKNGFQLFLSNGGSSIDFNVGNGSSQGSAEASCDMETGKWYFAAAIYDGHKLRIYVNGVMMAETDFDGGPIALSGYDITIGRDPAYGPADFFNGAVDDVRLYARALNRSEIMEYSGSESSTGLMMVDSGDLEIWNNRIENYGSGMYLGNMSDSRIHNNNIGNSTGYGVYIDSLSSGNRLYNNSFYFNHGSTDHFDPAHVQAYDAGNNWWNTSAPNGSTHGYGNYWYDWAHNNNTNDQNGDGIVDWPYPIDGKTVRSNATAVEDYYPLTQPTPVPEFGVLWVPVMSVLALFFVFRRRTLKL